MNKTVSARASQSLLHYRQSSIHTHHRPALPPIRPGSPIRRAAPRYASTVQSTTIDSSSLIIRLKNIFYGTSIVLGLGFGYLYITDTRASFHQWLVVPALRTIYLDAEEAHHAGTAILKALHSFGLNPRERGNPDGAGDLHVEIFGHTLDNPIGTSAGIDKNAELPSPLLALGPAIVEVGGVTPLPQEGNPKPRVFRIPSQNALINRYGLNSEGADFVAMRLRQRVREFAYQMGLGIDEEAERVVLDGEAGVPPGSLTPGKLLAVQIAKNKDTPDRDLEAVKRDYVYCVKHLGKYADIIVVNVSSPNTPGLRSLQNVGPLTHILTGVVQAVKDIDRKTKPVVMVKVSPDEDSESQISGICEAVWDSGVDGVIVGNTTKKRPDPIPKGYIMPSKEASLLVEQGGYSGPQMFERTLALVKRYRNTLDQGPKADSSKSQFDKPITSAPSGDSIESSLIGKMGSDQLSPESSLPKSNTDRNPDLNTMNLPAKLNPPAELVSKGPITANPPSQKSKVIFATGGITNGKQAIEVLNAGASVAMVYTAMIYSGAGTVSRIKSEMRDEIRKT
ncbi:FMN-linked oxidoreductase [Glonium stellatum]|uniref:Dihydroorotate dehydrogenase (quinone), mitochondrial n=1 Tax=Glonium stellatum TaxID=574774 RepID=A0A8E2F5Y7_9PEZI|nr:FMN-linked oxidoreductase [Glonium stellatum]